MHLRKSSHVTPRHATPRHATSPLAETRRLKVSLAATELHSSKIGTVNKVLPGFPLRVAPPRLACWPPWGWPVKGVERDWKQPGRTLFTILISLLCSCVRPPMRL